MSLYKIFSNAVSPLSALIRPLRDWTFSTRGLQLKFAIAGSALCLGGSIGVGLAVGKAPDDL